MKLELTVYLTKGNSESHIVEEIDQVSLMNALEDSLQNLKYLTILNYDKTTTIYVIRNISHIDIMEV